ncbi:type II secretion system protein [bacterium]|nr:type II secretion system protein [bacterium]
MLEYKIKEGRNLKEDNMIKNSSRVDFSLPEKLDCQFAGRRKTAFTLAEVLITLGIIGVVAAMTLPTLMAQYRKNIIEVRLKQTYSIMNQALRFAEVDYGDMTDWDYPIFEQQGSSAYDWFQKYLQPYIKTDTLYKAYHLWQVWYRGFAVEFINGTGLSCGINTGGYFACLFYPKAGEMKDVRDYSTQAQKLVPGKDYFVFVIQHESQNNKGFQPFPSDSCYQTTGFNWLNSPGCAKIIIENNWKIPDDYPVKI